MKLEVGMHAYSKTCRDYGIGKIVNITENGQGFRGDLIDIQYKYSKHAIENHDVVASHNIIDLIEEGDYVNGLPVTRICIDDETNEKYLNMFGSISEYGSEDIKSIVTKEQFDSMKYEVDSNEWNWRICV